MTEAILDDANIVSMFQALRAHNDTVYALVFDPSGGRLASGSKHRTIRIWDSIRDRWRA